jgi:hypothetical protein
LVDFTNILRASFKCADLKSEKNTVKQSVFKTLFGPVHVKAASKMLVNSAPLKQSHTQIIHKAGWAKIG